MKSNWMVLMLSLFITIPVVADTSDEVWGKDGDARQTLAAANEESIEDSSAGVDASAESGLALEDDVD